MELLVLRTRREARRLLLTARCNATIRLVWPAALGLNRMTSLALKHGYPAQTEGAPRSIISSRLI